MPTYGNVLLLRYPERTRTRKVFDGKRPDTPKTLIFSFDGTGNEPRDAREFKNDESVSNMLKLHILLGGGIQEDRSDTETPQENSQITYYYNGIGTREGGRQIIVMNGSGACLPYNAMRLFWNNHRSMGDLS